MTVNLQYAQDHLAELLDTAESGQEIEIAREGRALAKLIVMPLQSSVPDRGEMVLGAGRGEIVLPTAEEWKAMDQEIADLMLNGPLFPSTTR